jgi:hypothetical protein
MPFIVPQFIERKPKIVGPLNITQVFYTGVGVVIAVYLYYAQSFLVFIVGSALSIGGGLLLSFHKIKGIPLPTIIKNAILFRLSSKIYLWKKTSMPPKMTRGEKKEELKKEEPIILDIAGKSKLRNLSEKTEGY